MTAETMRRTQAERSAGTRRALLDATVKCLFRHGYAATNTNMVAEAAGLSRGGMLHQYPSKADLMAAVVEADYHDNIAFYHEQLDGALDLRERMIAYPRAAWRAWSRPSGVAVLEIMLASRSDAALAEKLTTVMRRVDGDVRIELSREFPRGLSAPLVRLVTALARGLAISQVVAEDQDWEDALVLFQQMLRTSVEAGMFSAGGRGSVAES